MSEVENSTTTDIDNNVQETPKSTPRKRLSRAEKARIESEELLKAFGVTMEAGRQTRSSRRGTTAVETPKPEPAKRKQPSTPRAKKKAKIDFDQIDSTNHVEEGNIVESQIAKAPIATSSAPAKAVENDAGENPIASQPVSNNGESEQKMEVDNPIECTQSGERTRPEAIAQPKSVLQPEVIEDSPIAESPIDDEPPIEEDSLPITIEDVQPSTAVEITEIIDDENVSASVDTTATLVLDSEPIVISPPLSEGKNEPIELQSSPSDTDPNDETIVNNSQVVPDAIVDLESSSNEGDAKNETANNSQEANSLDLEIINSDSSFGETQDEPSQPTSTSTAEVTITKINDAEPVAKTNDNSVHSSEPPKNSVESTNQKPTPENFRTKITSVDTPIEEKITTTSETPVKPNATTA